MSTTESSSDLDEIIDEEIGKPTSTNTTLVDDDDEEDNDIDDIPVRVTCDICAEVVSSKPATCAGTTPHILCEECFCGYAEAEFDPLGAFEGERLCGEELVSYPGELPCPRFILGDCNCAKIPATTLARVLSTDEDVLEMYEQAKRRLITAEEERNRKHDVEAQARAEPRTLLQKLRADVQEALSLGGYVSCPDCGIHGQKNDACMHMTCPCGTRYCYCCGRRRGESAGECPPSHTGNGCDASHIYIQGYAGWENLAIGTVSTGEGALHEFHRYRMMFFLRQVKSKYSQHVWNTLQQESPEIFQDVPTPGRSIGWRDIDDAGPPLFGATNVNQLRWRNAGLHIRNDIHQDYQDSHNSNTEDGDNGNATDGDNDNASEGSNDDDDFFAVWVESFDDNNFGIAWCTALAITIIFLSLRAVSESKAIRVLGGLGMALLATTGFPVLMFCAINSSAENNDEFGIQPFAGVRHQTLPYLAAGGKWHQYRMLHWVALFGGISLGSLIISNSENDFARAVGIGMLVAIFLFYSAGIVIVNLIPEPLVGLEPAHSKYRSTMTRLKLYGVLVSVGVILANACNETTIGIYIGMCFVALGIAGAVSEILARIAVADGEYPLSRAPDAYQLFISYVFVGGMTLGSLMVGMVGLGNKHDDPNIGKVITGGVFTIIVSIFACMCKIRSFRR